MTHYRDMLRFHDAHFSNVSIAKSLGVGRNTVSRALKRAAEEGLNWEIACGMSEGEVAERLYGNKRTDRKPNQEESPYLQPDCEWIARETARPNVTLRLLWTEYTVKADEAGKNAYWQTQFNKIYAEYRRTAKSQCTRCWMPVRGRRRPSSSARSASGRIGTRASGRP